MTTEQSKIQALEARIMNLEATIASLQPSQRAKRQAAMPRDTAATIRPSRRSLLGFLAGIGAGTGLVAASVADAAEAVSAAAAQPTGQGLGPWKVYTPELKAEQVNPDLGDTRRSGHGIWSGGPGRNGHYWQFGRTVVVKAWIQFNAGTQPGEGQYRLTLPVPAAVGSDAWVTPMGTALMRHASTKSVRNANVLLITATLAGFWLDNSTDSDAQVSHNSPWVWSEGDGLNAFMLYEAASDP